MSSSGNGHSPAFSELQHSLLETADLLFAVLVGSRANDIATAQSDWDIAVLWQYGDSLSRIAKHESLRRKLAAVLNVPEHQIDLIDLANAGLTMKSLVAEEGNLLALNNELSWAKFLVRTWRELEDYYWDQEHAA